jgi:hypothetical protein
MLSVVAAPVGYPIHLDSGKRSSLL